MAVGRLHCVPAATAAAATVDAPRAAAACARSHAAPVRESPRRAPLLQAAQRCRTAAAAGGDEPGCAQVDEPGEDADVELDERGARFRTRGAYFNPHAAQARDLAVLTAELVRLATLTETGAAAAAAAPLRVLDVMCASGVRSLRYLQHAGAAYVHANDVSPAAAAAADANRRGAAAAASWRVTRDDACRLLTRAALEGELFDVVDVDGFGVGAVPPGLAMGALRFGGALLLTSTDGVGMGGRAPPAATIGAYGALARPHPWANEQGLRLLLGAAALAAAQRGLRATPLWSLFTAAGPSYRCAVRVERSRQTAAENLGFVAHCPACGGGFAVPWDGLGRARCDCGDAGGEALSVAGPMWVGPLHDAGFVRGMTALADERGWLDSPPLRPGSPPRRSLRELLALMEGEAHPALPPLYLRLDAVSARGKVARTPGRDALLGALRGAGFAACRSHVDDERGIKTSASMSQLVAVARAAAGASEGADGPRISETR